MRYRRFGRTGRSVSEVGVGMWGMGSWHDADDDASMAALEEAVRLGCTFFDTAWGYGEGRSEGLLGRLVRAHPEKGLYTATKIPPKNRRWPSRRGFRVEDVFPPDYIEEYVHRSLENAGLDRFDLMQFHVWEDDWSEDDAWYARMDDLRRQGLFSEMGISLNRWEPWNGIRTVRSGRIDAVQVIYNVFDRNPEDELFPACAEHDVAIIARVPFDEGSLTGTLTRDSSWPPGDWRSLYFTPQNLVESVTRAEAVAAALPDGMGLAEAALRFTLSDPRVATVIPGMRQLRNVRANCAASDAGPLEPGLLATLRAHRWDRQPTATSF